MFDEARGSNAVNTTSIETASGTMFDVADPRPGMILIGDIAWGLSRCARFAGHTLGDVPYSVAQHSVYVCGLVSEALTSGTALAGELDSWLLDHIPDDDIGFVREGVAGLRDSEGHRCMGALAALMHDASEAYLVDIPTPVKRMPDLGQAYKAVECRIMEAIVQALGVAGGPVIGEVVHWADAHALAVEAFHLMPSRGLTWESIKLRPNPAALRRFGQPLPAIEAHDAFLRAYEALRQRATT